MHPEIIRAWWFHRQGLDGSLAGAPAAGILAKTGWARSVGGANPYLSLFARGSVSKDQAEKAAASVEIHELPCARGCTYVVPKEHYALALTVGQGFSDASAMATATKFLGVTVDEIDRLQDRVVEALKSGPMDPKQIKEAVGDAARSLGEEGKKRGQTTTLPLALGKLQSAARIRRLPVDGRLDNQRYKYTVWSPSPLEGGTMSKEEAYQRLARLYFQWIGPASLANFQWFSGLGVKASKAAVEGLGLEPLEEGSELLILPEDREEVFSYRAPKDEQVALIGSIDGLVHLRRDLVMHLDERDRGQEMQGEKLYTVGGVQDLSNHGIFDRGRLIGLWEYDPQAREIAWRTFSPPTQAVKEAVERTQAFVRDQLGDARSFSLDSPESRKPRLEALRKGAINV